MLVGGGGLVVIIIRILQLLIIPPSLAARRLVHARLPDGRQGLVAVYVSEAQFQFTRIAIQLRRGNGAILFLGFSAVFVLVELHAINIAINNRYALLLCAADAHVAAAAVVDLNVAAAELGVARERWHDFHGVHVEAENIWLRCARVLFIELGWEMLTQRRLICFRE